VLIIEDLTKKKSYRSEKQVTHWKTVSWLLQIVDLKAEQKQFRTHVVFETLTMNVLFKHHYCSCLENCIEKKNAALLHYFQLLQEKIPIRAQKSVSQCKFKLVTSNNVGGGETEKTILKCS
jgi:hypothetical protein